MCALDHNLQGAASMVATTLRGKGQSVDLVLESKPLKWYQAPSFYCETFTSYLINLSGI